MKRSCIVFGAGQLFETYIIDIGRKYDVLAVVDNNSQLQGSYKCGYEIQSPDIIRHYSYSTVLICSVHAKEIQLQLLEMDVDKISVLIVPGMIFDYGISDTAREIRFYEPPYKKDDEGIHILFTQISPCARTNRYVKLLTKYGIKCSLAYMGVYGREMQSAEKYYEQTIRFFSYSDLIEYVKESQYDLIHCSNEPDVLTCLLMGTGKPIVHDCHDFISLRDELSADAVALELIANSRSDGCIYPSKQCLQIAIERYSVQESNAIYFENYPSRDSLPKTRLRKISSIDNEIHCVYEGAISDNPNSYRYFEEQWRKLASLGIHVHFYTQFNEAYCVRLASISDKIHYEGNLDPKNLLLAMTQYDVGLCTYVEHPNQKIKLDTACPNKLYEYLAAGLPLVLSNHKYHSELTSKYDVGRVLDWDSNIVDQIKSISNIQIPDEFILNNGFTMEAEAAKLIRFYKNMIS